MIPKGFGFDAGGASQSSVSLFTPLAGDNKGCSVERKGTGVDFEVFFCAFYVVSDPHLITVKAGSSHCVVTSRSVALLRVIVYGSNVRVNGNTMC